MFRFLVKRNFGTSATRYLNDPILEKLGIKNKNLLRNLRFCLKNLFFINFFNFFQILAFLSFMRMVATEVNQPTQTPDQQSSVQLVPCVPIQEPEWGI